jgi:hypothetical protein
VEEFPLRLSEKEVELNKEVPITIDYGARRGFLTNKATYVVTLEQDGGAGQIQPLLVGGIAAAALLAIMYIIYRLFTKKKGKGAKS